MSRSVDDSSSGSSSKSSSGQLDRPPQVPDLELVHCIGRGGFGRVWLARNRATGQLRAVKVVPLRRRDTTDPAGREIASITRLEENVRRRHPNLLCIHHVGKTADHLFYIMDPADDVSGTPARCDPQYRPATLASRLAGGPLPPHECLRLARQLLSGLASLHAAGMVHRDVKPANCLFVAGELKLADFGLLTEAHPQVSRLGTVKYMPPDGRMDARADVYAAGLVIYEMLTGLPPEGFPRLGRRARQLAADPVLTALNRLVLRASQGDPQLRFQDAAEMLAELRVPDPEIAASRARLRRRMMVALAYLLVAGATAAVVLWPVRPQAGYLPVDVNFITDRFEATIHLDGRQQFRPDAAPYTTPYTTPCTIEDLPARPHRVVFKLAGRPDLEFPDVDFATTREIEAAWHPAP